MPHIVREPVAVVPADAFRTSGTSPTVRPSRKRHYDTVHLLGPGAVGRALLQRLATDRRRLVAVSDSTATLYDAAGLDALAVAQWKQGGRRLLDHPHAQHGDTTASIAAVDADIVVDASSTDLEREGWTGALDAALGRGACLAAAAKAALCDAGAEWLVGTHRHRVGCNAVLGGTGRSFAAELPELQQRARAVAIVGNASTTAIIQAVEAGGALEDGISRAQQLGYLEPDPELDLRGADAAVKLAIVAGAITGSRVDPRDIVCDDIRDLDPLVVRARARRHATTRLVARLLRDGSLRVAYEEVPLDSLLATPCGRVVYEYRLTRDERRLHIGTGLGADPTAAALWSDVRALAATASATSQRRGAR